MLYLLEEGSTLRYQNNRLVITREKTVIKELPIEQVKAVVLFSGTHVTTPCIERLLINGIPVTFLSTKGYFFGRLDSTKHVNIRRQRMQFLMAENEDFCLALAKKFVGAKIKNAEVLLRRYNRYINNDDVQTAIKNISVILNEIEKAKSREQLNGLEGSATRIYFQALGRMTRNGYVFERRTRQPPRDPFNSMLSFGYTLLMYEIYTIITNYGLNPYLGYLHEPRSGHPALASDLMEEWRPVIIDSMVMSIVHTNHITLEQFYPPDEQGGVYLTKEGARIFIKRYMYKMGCQNKYLCREGFGQTFRDTLAIQVSALTETIETGDPERYNPLIIR